MILAYHSVSPVRRDPIAVPVEAFRTQVSWLARHGWRGVTLGEYLAAPAPRRGLVAFTFDDGYADVAQYAAHILESEGWRATLFVVTGLTGTDRMLKPERYLEKYGGRAEDYRMLTWEAVGALAKRGYEIGSHSVTHPLLTTLPDEEALHEMAESRRMIESRLGVSARWFCYPSGDHDTRIAKLVREAGYEGACVTPSGPGVTESPFTHRRIGVYRSDGPFRFRVKMSPAFTSARDTGWIWSTWRTLTSFIS